MNEIISLYFAIDYFDRFDWFSLNRCDKINRNTPRATTGVDIIIVIIIAGNRKSMRRTLSSLNGLLSHRVIRIRSRI